jgi:hypothetical protein
MEKVQIKTKPVQENHEDRFIFQISATKKLDLRSLNAHDKDLNAL